MKTRTLLVDGNYLLKRSIHGAKDISTNSFGHIGGLYQFFTTLRKLIKQYGKNKIVIMWDGESGGIHRYRIDKKYKANRTNKSWHNKIVLSDVEIEKEEKKQQSTLKQKLRIQAYAEELYLRQIEVDEIEADDLIAEYCIKYNNKEEITIFTNDRDFSQLLYLNIKIIFGNIEQPIDKRNFFFHFPYSYENALTVKIICGDTSDNIDGVSGLKERGLIKYFPDLKYRKMSVKEICLVAKKINYERAQNKKKPLLALENLLNSVERLKINFKLINLRKPYLNEQAIEELEQLYMPLSDEDRSSKNLYKMMIEDEFLTIYNSNFTNYVEPFYSVIMNEKDNLKFYFKNK